MVEGMVSVDLVTGRPIGGHIQLGAQLTHLELRKMDRTRAITTAGQSKRDRDDGEHTHTHTRLIALLIKSVRSDCARWPNGEFV